MQLLQTDRTQHSSAPFRIIFPAIRSSKGCIDRTPFTVEFDPQGLWEKHERNDKHSSAVERPFGHLPSVLIPKPTVAIQHSAPHHLDLSAYSVSIFSSDCKALGKSNQQHPCASLLLLCMTTVPHAHRRYSQVRRVDTLVEAHDDWSVISTSSLPEMAVQDA